MLEDENKNLLAEVTHLNIANDHLRLKHSHTVVENSQLTNEKVRLEYELRKSENKCEIALRIYQDNFQKEVSFSFYSHYL